MKKKGTKTKWLYHKRVHRGTPKDTVMYAVTWRDPFAGGGFRKSGTSYFKTLAEAEKYAHKLNAGIGVDTTHIEKTTQAEIEERETRRKQRWK